MIVKILWLRARMNGGFPSRRKRLLGFSCEGIERAYQAYLTENHTVYNPKKDELIVLYEKCQVLSIPKFERNFRHEVDLNLQNVSNSSKLVYIAQW
ncbi:unnamed protein product [Cylicocyclus nassatus]|uniref:Uncharacterized protein n=1 Tax=Cylicocyclus nassatus TaxID=53992 RepID=A0AA36DNN0_CYLNA|nr:unnamed protein product [Cylicocyclus nassatus]